MTSSAVSNQENTTAELFYFNVVFQIKEEKNIVVHKKFFNFVFTSVVEQPKISISLC